MTKRKFVFNIFILGLAMIGVLWFISRVIVDLINLYQVEKDGQIIEAEILDLDSGLNKISIRYMVNNKTYERDISVGNEVYSKYSNEKSMKIKVLGENPKIITFEKNRALYVEIFNLILLVIGGTVLAIVLIFSIISLPKIK
jgi:hypothetical protein